MNRLRLPLLVILLLMIGFSISNLFDSESRRRVLKEDFIELSNAKYGIFNIDEWKVIISEIISKKVDEFNLEDENREVMREKIQTFLYKVLSESEDNFNDQKSGSLFGMLQRSVASVTDIFGHLKSEIPKITEDILTFLDDPENRNQIKVYLQNLVNSYADETFASVNYAQLDIILEKYGAESKHEGMEVIQFDLDELAKNSIIYQWLIAIAVTMFLLVFLFTSALTKKEIVLGLLVSLILLLSGILLPMIDIDARISSFTFSVLGEPISFENQVLYYKSKSILEVVSLMMSQGKLNIFMVGLLVLSFSVLFPLTKLIASGVFLYNPSVRSQRWIQFFVFKSGKWSMADVMVVAIFMSYIGLSSILTEQLRQLETIGKNLEILTTNESTLNLGFFLFTAFVVMGLTVANRIEKI